MNASKKIYQYKSVVYAPCPLCRNESYYIYEIIPGKKLSNYFSLKCKKCASEIYYNDLSHIVNKYKLIDEHKYKKFICNSFSLIVVCSIAIAIIFSAYEYGSKAYEYGNKYYKKLTRIRAYEVNYQPKLDTLSENDLLLIKHPKYEEDGYLIVRILKINHDQILTNMYESQYKNKENLISDIIYQEYGRTQADHTSDVYTVPKQDIDELFKQAVLIRKKMDKK